MSEAGTDVCVVGGGPAGLMLALLLLRSGLKVTVVEKARSLERDYRGEILQPGGLRILDQAGVLPRAKARGSYELTRFQLMDGSRPVMDMDYRRLPAPHNYLLSLPQRHLLAELGERCREQPGFVLLSGYRASELVRAQATGAISGVVADSGTERVTVRARCVVGADGRYSKVRALAGIGNHRYDVFDLDVVWFKLPWAGEPTGRVRIFRAPTNPALVYDAFPGAIQIGWTVPHGGYRAVAARGLAEVTAQIRQSVPEYAGLIDAHITSLTDLKLLDVFGARARRWATDGLVLLGDAAHTHSPLGAQGINLALQDAAILHPILVRALADGDLSGGRLDEFERRRGRDIDGVMRFQKMQSKGMFAAGGLAGFLQPLAGRLLMQTPVGAKITRHVTLGNPGIRLAHELFDHAQPRQPLTETGRIT